MFKKKEEESFPDPESVCVVSWATRILGGVVLLLFGLLIFAGAVSSSNFVVGSLVFLCWVMSLVACWRIFRSRIIFERDQMTVYGVRRTVVAKSEVEYIGMRVGPNVYLPWVLVYFSTKNNLKVRPVRTTGWLLPKKIEAIISDLKKIGWDLVWE